MADASGPSPYDFFDEALVTKKPIIVKLRFGHIITGILRAYDRHLNLVFSDATETWVENGIEVREKKQNFMLRGDTVVMVASN